MAQKLNIGKSVSWIAVVILFALGVLNVILVHPVPGVVYLLLSLGYLPQVSDFFRNRMGFQIPVSIKILLFIVVIWFTLGISDLADMYGI